MISTVGIEPTTHWQEPTVLPLKLTVLITVNEIIPHLKELDAEQKSFIV